MSEYVDLFNKYLPITIAAATQIYSDYKYSNTNVERHKDENRSTTGLERLAAQTDTFLNKISDFYGIKYYRAELSKKEIGFLKFLHNSWHSIFTISWPLTYGYFFIAISIVYFNSLAEKDFWQLFAAGGFGIIQSLIFSWLVKDKSLNGYTGPYDKSKSRDFFNIWNRSLFFILLFVFNIFFISIWLLQYSALSAMIFYSMFSVLVSIITIAMLMITDGYYISRIKQFQQNSILSARLTLIFGGLLLIFSMYIFHLFELSMLAYSVTAIFIAYFLLLFRRLIDCLKFKLNLKKLCALDGFFPKDYTDGQKDLAYLTLVEMLVIIALIAIIYNFLGYKDIDNYRSLQDLLFLLSGLGSSGENQPILENLLSIGLLFFFLPYVNAIIDSLSVSYSIYRLDKIINLKSIEGKVLTVIWDLIVAISLAYMMLMIFYIFAHFFGESGATFSTETVRTYTTTCLVPFHNNFIFNDCLSLHSKGEFLLITFFIASSLIPSIIHLSFYVVVILGILAIKFRVLLLTYISLASIIAIQT